MACEACGVDWDREKAVVFIAGVTKVMQDQVECTALVLDQGETLSLSSEVKFKKWLLPIKREVEPQLLFVTCCARTLKVIVSVNLPWDSYLCAPFAPALQRTVVSLRAKAGTVVGSEIATLQSVHFCHQSQLVTVELTSGNVIIFDQWGVVGRLSIKGSPLYGQNLSENFDLVKPVTKFSSVHFGDTSTVAFDGHTIYVFDSKKTMP